jgi:hypothetical protein
MQKESIILLIGLSFSSSILARPLPAEPHPAGLAPALSATSAPPAGGSASPPAPRGQLFISPAGEPFRSPEGAPYPTADWFLKADSNGDGQLTLPEFIADGMRYFRLLDSNRNGELEASEIDAYEASVLAPLTPRPGARGNAPGEEKAAEARPIQMPATAAQRRQRPDPARPRGAGLYGIINIRQPVKAADQDMNSRVSTQEWEKILGSRFTLLDKANRGYLTLDDLPPTPWQEMQPGYKPKKK